MTPAKKKPPEPQHPFFPPAGSPFWAFANTIAVFAFVTVLCVLTAKKFDEDEIIKIAGATSLMVGLEGFKAFIRRDKK